MQTFLIIAAFFAAVLLVGSMSYQDMVEEDAFYTQMVCEGTWPDYKNLSPVCATQ